MDPSIVKLLEDDEDETMHSGADVEAFQAALNRDLGGGHASTSQPSSDSDPVLPEGSSHTVSPSLPHWPAGSQDEKTDYQLQDQKLMQQQEQSASEMGLKQDGDLVEQNQNVASQEVNNLSLPQKQSQIDSHQGQGKQSSLQNLPTIGIQNSEKDHMPNHEPVRMHNTNSESQYLKLQKMSNQQATVSEQAGSSINRTKQVPFGLLLPILQSQLDKDRAMQLHSLFLKLKKDEIPKEGFVRLMKGLVGDQMLRLALSKVQSQQKPSAVGQHLLRTPSVNAGAAQLTDPHGFSQLHQRDLSSPADPSHTPTSAVQVKSEATYPMIENNAKKSQGLDRKVEPHNLQQTQLQASRSNTKNQETERSSMGIQGLNKQQQQQQASAFPICVCKPQTNDSQLRQIPQHQSMGLNQLGGPTQGTNIMIERKTSISDPKRIQGGSVSSLLNSSASQQTLIPWQPSTNKEQNSGTLSSISYIKKEPSDQTTEPQHKHQLSKFHGLPSISASQIEQGNAIPGTLSDEYLEKQSSRIGLPSPTSMSVTASTSLIQPNTASSSVMAQLGPNTPLSSHVPPNTSPGIIGRPTPKKTSLGQKKPLEALGSSPPPPNKKQKVSGASVEQSIEQLNDVTAVSGVDLREEEEQLFSGPKEDNRFSEASRRAVQEEEERLILQKAPLQKKLVEIMVKSGLKNISNDVERCLSLCVEERMRSLISSLIRLSKQRADSEKTRHRTAVTSDVRQQIMIMNFKAREEWEKKQAEAEKLRKLSETESNTGVDGDNEKDEGRAKSIKSNKEDDDKMRTTAANVAARAAVGGDDMLSKWQLMAEQRQKREGGMDTASGSHPVKDVSQKTLSTFGRNSKDNEAEKLDGAASISASAGTARKFGRNQGVPQTRVARSISVKDVIAVLEREPQMSKSSLIYRLYERLHSGATAE
ncbi:transcription initiation factor TFIID subunit 4b-like [Quillaja saponaria]|uniref:Transcription initiation factor TFIID subunit 4b-like n=1 Tax=Quillaja saponaria TaxID=32244 RepID=A0AAD7M3H2_QUISA|nr:transcription initiation factor TFIID subunit 4b-like [Quillaja saponaria]